MNNDFHIADPKTSFAQLKTSARSDSDVCAWFLSNKHCLPTVPERFKPHLEFTAPNGINFSLYEKNTVERQIDMHFRATLPSSTEETLSADAFKELTGQNVEILRVVPNEETFDTELRVKLLAHEWPYVACEAALYIWGAPESIKAKCMKEHLQNAWDIVFPHLPWGTVDQMFAAGLLPLDPDEFKAWAMTATPTQASTIALPEGITL